jgi:hypothetical protein
MKTRNQRLLWSAFISLYFNLPCLAQSQTKPIRQDALSCLKVAAFGGAGAVTGSQNRGIAQLGASLSCTPPDILFGIELEGGYVGGFANNSGKAAIFSVNYKPSWTLNSCTQGACAIAFATAGYTQLFGTGNALNYGVGMEYFFATQPRAIRLEVRDYQTFGIPNQHNVALRAGFLWVLGD